MNDHPYVELVDPFTNESALIDELMVPCIKALWDVGIETFTCCQATAFEPTESQRLWYESQQWFGFKDGWTASVSIWTRSSQEVSRVGESAHVVAESLGIKLDDVKMYFDTRATKVCWFSLPKFSVE